MQKPLKGLVDGECVNSSAGLHTATQYFLIKVKLMRTEALNRVEWICCSIVLVLFLAVQAWDTTRRALISPRAGQNAINPASISPSPRRSSLVCIIWAFALY